MSVVSKTAKLFGRKTWMTAACVMSLSLVTVSSHVQAWGQTGHRIIGQIALNHLTPVAKERVLALLSGDRLPEVTTWADEQRSNPAEFWQKTSSKWHYINAEKSKLQSLHKHPMPFTDEPSDIYTAILKNISVLQNPKASSADKEFHLRFLTHLIGDLHMPLHVGRAEDRGGNSIKVKFFFQPTNLHRLWDSGLIEKQNLSYTEFAEFIDTDKPEEVSEMISTPIHDWIYESYEYTQRIYEIGNGDYRYNYQYEYMPLVKQRLLEGGVRLAGVLNKIFDPEAKPGVQALKSFQ